MKKAEEKSKPEENAARFHAASIEERSKSSTLGIRPASRNHAKKLRQRASKGENVGDCVIGKATAEEDAAAEARGCHLSPRRTTIIGETFEDVVAEARG